MEGDGRGWKGMEGDGKGWKGVEGCLHPRRDAHGELDVARRPGHAVGLLEARAAPVRVATDLGRGDVRVVELPLERLAARRPPPARLHGLAQIRKAHVVTAAL